MTFTHNASSQSEITPDRALEMLLEGNQRFLDKRAEARDYAVQIEATSGGQWPYAVVLTCIDSRVPVEVVLDAGIGDVFAARIAGNFVNADILGSMEFACKLAGAKLVVVMGHTSCGAVKGACDHAELGNLTGMLENIMPAVNGTSEPADPAQRTSKNSAFVRAVTDRNVLLTIERIRSESPVLAEMERAGEIAIVGAIYDVTSGRVDVMPETASAN